MASLSAPGGWRQRQIWAGYVQRGPAGAGADQEDSGTSKAPVSGSWCLTVPRRCLLSTGGEEPIPVHPRATAISVKDNRRLLTSLQVPVEGVPACLRAQSYWGRGYWAQLPLSLELLTRYSVKLTPNQGSSHLNLEMGVESWNRFEPVHNELQLGLCFVITLAFTLKSCARNRPGLFLLSLEGTTHCCSPPSWSCLPSPPHVLYLHYQNRKRKKKQGK